MPHGTIECDIPTALDPLFSLFHTLTELAFIGGVVLGTLGFLAAGMFFMLPGDDNNRRGKLAAKNTLIGTILLLSARMIMTFLTSQLGSSICA
ncbi:MAG: hypothetical protein SVU32_05255 [Candidatus Nanohaloarchaea archaeon]|nr:hypothetical protein [Candidatus Nanohaloarchaea archaeon]